MEGAPAPEAALTRALYEQYANQIFRYCLHQLGSREEAEDATQSTFLNAFRGIKRGIVPETESAWLFTIAHNVCLSRRRSTWRRGKIESPADFDVVQELTPAPSRRADELIGLQDVLEQLPEQQRRAILLREWQGLSYREIADELEVSQAAVETLIFRARRSLAQGLEQPVAPTRRRALAGALGNLLSSVQSFLLGGGAAVKVAATVAAVGATTVVATAPTQKHAPARTPQPQGAVRPAEARPARAGGTSGPVTTPVFAGGVQRPAAPARSAPAPVRARATPTAPLVAPEPAPPVARDATPAPPVQPAPPQPGAEPPAKTEAPGQTTRAGETARAGEQQQSAKPESPGQAKKADGEQSEAKPDAPGQAMKPDDPPADTPAVTPAVTPADTGRTDAPGQAKKNDAVGPPPAQQPAPVEPSQAAESGKPDKLEKDKPKK